MQEGNGGEMKTRNAAVVATFYRFRLLLAQLRHFLLHLLTVPTFPNRITVKVAESSNYYKPPPPHFMTPIIIQVKGLNR